MFITSAERDGSSLLWRLDEAVLSQAPWNSVIWYGCEEFQPGHNYKELIDNVASGAFIGGAVGLTVNLESVISLKPPLREAIGRILLHSLESSNSQPVIAATDRHSIENLLHFGIRACDDLCIPALLATTDDARSLIANNCAEYTDGVLNRLAGHPLESYDLSALIIAAITGDVFRFKPKLRGDRLDELNYHPAVRVLRELGATINYNDLKAGPIEIDMGKSTIRENVKRLQESTLRVLERAIAPKTKPTTPTLADALDAVIPVQKNESNPEPHRGMPELVVGAVFDPTKHYVDDYYGDGNGILYTRPDGTKTVYRGPSKTWGGFDFVAETIVMNIDNCASYLSLGCGAGSDVLAFQKQGVAAEGIDISEAAIAYGREHLGLGENLVCGDFLAPDIHTKLKRKTYDLVATYDFLEHNWKKDIPELLRRMASFVAPGGRMIHVVCTHGDGEADFEPEAGVRVTPENGWCLVSGHVRVVKWTQWALDFLRYCPEFEIDYPQHSYLCVRFSENPEMRSVGSWSPRNLIVLKRK